MKLGNLVISFLVWYIKQIEFLMSLTCKTFSSAFNLVSSSLWQHTILNIATTTTLLQKLLIWLSFFSVLCIDWAVIFTFYSQFHKTDALLSFPFSEPLLERGTVTPLTGMWPDFGLSSKPCDLKLPSGPIYTVADIVYSFTSVSSIWHFVFPGSFISINWLSFSFKLPLFYVNI